MNEVMEGKEADVVKKVIKSTFLQSFDSEENEEVDVNQIEAVDDHLASTPIATSKMSEKSKLMSFEAV